MWLFVVVALDAITGVITLARSLDFEAQTEFSFVLTATDSDGLSSTALLLLIVDDENDEAPRFAESPLRADVVDNAASGQFVAMFAVDDRDSVSSLGDGARLIFSVMDGDDDELFNLDRHSGVVRTARQLLAAERQNMTLNVSVSDGLFTSYSQLIVRFVVGPTSFPLPRFERSQYFAAIHENRFLSQCIS
jgi:hypothetical protein